MQRSLTRGSRIRESRKTHAYTGGGETKGDTRRRHNSKKKGSLWVREEIRKYGG